MLAAQGIYAPVMELERQNTQPARRGPSLPAKAAIAALALFGAVSMVAWVLNSILSIVKFGLFVVVIVAVGIWVISAKGRR